MRIRNFHCNDLPLVLELQQEATYTDGSDAKTAEELAAWLLQPELDAEANAFVLTDDDDELNTWGQAGTLEGIEGEIIGYTVVQLLKEDAMYTFRCSGTVHPQQRRRHGGRALLICALNRARMLAMEFEFEAEYESIPIYFEAVLPANDPALPSLAAYFEMLPVDTNSENGMRLYRRDL